MSMLEIKELVYRIEHHYPQPSEEVLSEALLALFEEYNSLEDENENLRRDLQYAEDSLDSCRTEIQRLHQFIRDNSTP